MGVAGLFGPRSTPPYISLDGSKLIKQDSAFGVAVTIFTLGGLIGSLAGDAATRQLGRVGVLRLSGLLFAVGTAFVGLANSIIPLVGGR